MGGRRRSRKEKRDEKSKAKLSELGDSKSPPSKKQQVNKGSDFNPLWMEQSNFCESLSEQEKDCFFDEEKVDPERRAELWTKQADLGERLIRDYAWATPDDRALRVLRHFSPIIEIGCGSNAYWCRMMIQAGADVIGFDKDPKQGGKISVNQKDSRTMQSGNGDGLSFRVQKGGPEVLQDPKYAKHTLFLCYPDENVLDTEGNDDGGNGQTQSLGAACLEQFQGDTVIHVGELFSDSSLSMDQAPWGRSSSSEFQQLLASDYHCLLHTHLPNWLHTRDSLSVWRRSRTCALVFAADEGDEDDEDEEYHYRHIPPEEMLPVDRAAPCLAHLLERPKDKQLQSNEYTSPW
ncbi:hypothetical protein FisN_14Hh002 [Fistulifera solaris]|uniref:Methyltransferase domain-containing protein n=1 Tax=Fistulifera solaris TaxID=1519565 RepID=A0A1Z5K817_FISSO|nr:hypothetical protein FisN_14Hh002 [Fistulifera solaris]|eukprot:GAX22389.1 hypothetical protein FisN_14Hh002 [Fistulifera solaris]